MALLKWCASHPVLCFVLVTVVLCFLCGPANVGAWYGSAVRSAIAGVVAFFRGAF